MSKHIRQQTANCKFCGREKEAGRKRAANPYCSECYYERLEAAFAIDLRDNHEIIDHENGYVTVKPIDPTKKIKARDFR